jgi:hypothetical protein
MSLIYITNYQVTVVTLAAAVTVFLFVIVTTTSVPTAFATLLTTPAEVTPTFVPSAVLNVKSA